MPDSVVYPIQRVLSRVLTFWVKPDVLPVDPGGLIDPQKPILYVLEVGGLADRTALEIICKNHGMPSPHAAFTFGKVSLANSVDVLKQRKGMIFKRHRNVVSSRLGQLVEEGVKDDLGELQIVPVSIYWGRAPDKEQSLWKLMFTENWQVGGRTRKLITTLLHGRHTLLSFSEPLSFATLKSSGESSEILQRKLSRILRVHFRQRRIASLGPDQSHRRMLVDHVLSDSAVRAAIQKEAVGKVSIEQARAKAQQYACEIAADVSYPTVRILHRVLTWLWTQLYEGVELSGVKRLKSVADGNELVYVPCHRSHIDYLLLSYILYVQGFSLPHIAAGVNLNLPIVGGLLRRGGAFFLRRSFSGQALYAAVFNAYLKEILQRGHALEYFVEGGRSRTGRLLPAKGGMLEMTVHAFLQDPKTPVMFVPVYFGYERLLEGGAFTSELAGGKKQKESILGLVKALRTLKEDYGQVHVNFGQAIELGALISKHRPDWQSLDIAEQRPEWLKPIANDLGDTIMRSINEAACVTPISLLATVVLATPRGCMSRAELGKQIDLYQELLRKVHAGSLVVVPDVSADHLIERGKRLGFVESDRDAVGEIIQVKQGQASRLTYFRNNILHLLTLPALVAASVSHSRSRSASEIHRSVRLTFPFLQGELFLATDLDTQTIDQTLEAFLAGGLLTKTEDGWRRASAGSFADVTLLRLGEVVMPALERYYLFACILAMSADKSMATDTLARHCEASAGRLSRTHGRPANDLYDKHLHQVLVSNMIDHGFVVCEDDMVSPTQTMLDMEVEARNLLGEQARHAIINTALAIQTNTRQEVPGH